MNPRVVGVMPNNDFTLLLTFENNEKKVFDVKPYMNKGIFKELKDMSIFNTVKVKDGTVEWIHEQDFCPDTLYELSETYESEQDYK